mmetsp:Transcript_5279/g.19868  ORF Transcript_5279/g.19868 Transcript_5279/m.19868 type:complete len:200 (-) Transcript_5279:1037-1636(-)
MFRPAHAQPSLGQRPVHRVRLEVDVGFSPRLVALSTARGSDRQVTCEHHKWHVHLVFFSESDYRRLHYHLVPADAIHVSDDGILPLFGSVLPSTATSRANICLQMYAESEQNGVVHAIAMLVFHQILGRGIDMLVKSGQLILSSDAAAAGGFKAGGIDLPLLALRVRTAMPNGTRLAIHHRSEKEQKIQLEGHRHAQRI